MLLKRPIPRVYAYLEWFDPFDTMPLPNHDFYHLKRTIKDGHRMAIVVPIEHLQRSIHLFPAFNTKKANEIWKYDDVLEKCSIFCLNSFSDRHAYHHLT